MIFEELFDALVSVIKMPFEYLLSPGKRVYILYLISSALLALYVYKRSKIKMPFFTYLFKKEIWVGKSAVIDYGFIFFNSLIKVLIISPFVVYTLYMALWIKEYCNSTFGVTTLDWSKGQIAALYTFVLIVVSDFGTFIVHYMLHKIPFLWEFHKIHHSATVLNPFTQYRIHPVELILNNMKSIIVNGIITGIFMYLANDKVSLITFLGINILNFIFLFFGANLRHSHVKLKFFPILEFIFISPYQHQIHHSDNPRLYDTNLGSRLAIWDLLFGTLVRSKSVKHLRFGLGREDDKNYQSFKQNLLAPFKNLAKKIGSK